ncbi:hypothetical protein HDU76_010328, partial [Blyttiomyces sp. JEL0837]
MTPPILHRNLKSTNVMIHTDFSDESQPFLHAKLSDFDLVAAKAEAVNNKAVFRKGNSVANLTPTSLLWVAPELHDLHAQYTTSTDVFSYSIILTELASWKGPYAQSNLTDPTKSKALISQIVDQKQRPDMSSDLPDDVPDDFLDLIKKCWSVDPLERPKVAFVREQLHWKLYGTAAPSVVMDFDTPTHLLDSMWFASVPRSPAANNRDNSHIFNTIAPSESASEVGNRQPDIPPMPVSIPVMYQQQQDILNTIAPSESASEYGNDREPQAFVANGIPMVPMIPRSVYPTDQVHQQMYQQQQQQQQQQLPTPVLVPVPIEMQQLSPPQPSHQQGGYMQQPQQQAYIQPLSPPQPSHQQHQQQQGGYIVNP